jgi:hypothetical protein
MISLTTSVDDIRSSFKCNIAGHTVECFEEAIKKEGEGQNRTTVIKLLKRALRMKKQGATHI